jgi:GT2 family glycosyltransferase
MTLSQHPKVSVVVLSYNRPHLLPGALAALSVQTYPNLEVTVVDNHSLKSKEVSEVVKRFPNFGLVQNPENAGFAGGMNIGLRQTEGKYVLLTEDDLILEPNFVAALVDYFISHPKTGLAGGLLINHGTGTILCAGGDFRLGSVFSFRFNAEGEPETARFPEPFEAKFISGCMVFAARDFLLGELNGFREDFFLYYEDLDLCFRARRAGRPVVVVPQARGRHVEPPLGRPSDVVEYHKYKNLYSVYFLHASAAALPVFLLRYGPWALLKALLQGRMRDFLLMTKAWGYVVPRIPTFWRERRPPRILVADGAGALSLPLRPLVPLPAQTQGRLGE